MEARLPTKYDDMVHSETNTIVRKLKIGVKTQRFVGSSNVQSQF